MNLRRLFLTGALVPGLHAAVLEQLHAVPAGWTAVDRTAGDSTQTVFTIALQLSNLDKLEATVLDLSTPSSPNYGQWMDKDDVDAM